MLAWAQPQLSVPLGAAAGCSTGGESGRDGAWGGCPALFRAQPARISVSTTLQKMQRLQLGVQAIYSPRPCSASSCRSQGSPTRATSCPRHFSWAINPEKGFALCSRAKVKCQQMRILFSGLARADGCTFLWSTQRCAKVHVTTAVSYNNQK